MIFKINVIFSLFTLMTNLVIGQAVMDSCLNGIARGYPCHNVDLIKSMTPTSFLPSAIYDAGGLAYNPALDYGNDIWGWTDKISGREFVISGRKSGSSFIEVTDPTNPVYIGYLFGGNDNKRTKNSWRDMKTYDDYVYIVSEDYLNGIQIFDLRRLLNVNSPPIIFNVDTLVRITQSAGNPGSAHNIVSSEESKYMYVVGGRTNNCNGGLEFFNVEDPLHPLYEGCYNAENYTHDAVCFVYHGPDQEHIGKEICIASNERFQLVADMSDKSDVTTLSKVYYANSGYTHQGWVSDDHRFVLFNDELDETRFSQNTRTHIMNIENLDSSYYLGYFELSTSSTDHNCYIRGQYLYEANYESGLRIIDLKNLSKFPDSTLSEVAYMNFNSQSAWSVYPYFGSGTIAVNTIDGDLVLVRPRLPHFILSTSHEVIDVCTGDDIIFGIDVHPMYGYSDNIDLSISGEPSGTAVSLSQNSISAGGQVSLTISNTEILIGGNFSIKITGKGQNDKQMGEITAAFRVTSIPTDMTYSNMNFSANKIIRATNSITLDNISVNSSKNLTVYAPEIMIQNDLNLATSATLDLINQKNCSKY